MSLTNLWRQRATLVFSGLVFWAATAESQCAKWKFLVFGDTLQVNYSEPINTIILGELVTAITNEQPAFVLVLGDLTFLGTAAALQEWTNLVAPVWQTGTAVYPLIGNHESEPTAFAEVFGGLLPETGPPGEVGTYSFCYSNALFVLLNEFVSGNEYRVNQGWLNSVLATNTRPHIFVAGHTPAFKLYHSDCLGSYATNRDGLWNSLSNAHCRIYFCGHDHFYDHVRLDDGDSNPENDVHQVTVGTGGAALSADSAYDGTNGIWTPLRAYHEQQYGYVSVEVDADQVSATWHHRTEPGAYPATAEVFSYSATPRPLLTFEYADHSFTLKWSGGAILQAASDPAGEFVEVSGARSPYVVDISGKSQMFYRLARQRDRGGPSKGSVR